MQVPEENPSLSALSALLHGDASPSPAGGGGRAWCLEWKQKCIHSPGELPLQAPLGRRLPPWETMPPVQARRPPSRRRLGPRQGLPEVVREGAARPTKHSEGNEALERPHAALAIFFFWTKRKLKWAALVKCTPLSPTCAESLIWECEPLGRRTKDPFRGGDAADLGLCCCLLQAGMFLLGAAGAEGRSTQHVCTVWAWGAKPAGWGGGVGWGRGERARGLLRREGV